MCTGAMIGQIVSIAVGQIGGTALKVAAAKEQVKMAKDQRAWERELTTVAARDTLSIGRAKESAIRQHTSDVLSSQRAAYGASGIDVNSGSPVDVMGSTAAQGELDALNSRAQTTRQLYAIHVARSIANWQYQWKKSAIKNATINSVMSSTASSGSSAAGSIGSYYAGGGGAGGK